MPVTNTSALARLALPARLDSKRVDRLSSLLDAASPRSTMASR
jgi:hypothetical protein